jgi:hypothetical protein
VKIKVRATDRRDVCTLDDTPTTSEVALPAGVSSRAPLDVVVEDGGDATARLTLKPSAPTT